MKKTIISITTILVFLVASNFSFAQKNTDYEFIRSGETRIEAAELYDVEENPDYEAAFELLNKINENDTSYYQVQYDMAYLNYLDSNYEKSVEISDKALQRPNSKTADFINIKGLSLKRLEKYDESIELYQKAIKEFPKDYLLYGNLGSAYYANKEYQKAYDFYKQALKLNPYNTNNYRMLGFFLANSGKLTASALAYHMALLLKPEADNADNIIFFIEPMMVNEHTMNDSISIVDNDIPEYFNEIDEILRARLAKNKNYKVKSAFDYNVIRSTQVVCEKLQAPKNDTTFWNRFIIRNFYDIWNKDVFEGYSYYFFQSLTNTSLKKQLEKRSGAIEKFATWTQNDITNNILVDRRIEDKNFTPSQLSFYKNNHLYGYGPINEDYTQRINSWSYFHNNGRLMSQGGYDDDGKRHGDWNWYLDNGLPNESATYKNGELVGVFKKYNDLGFLTQKYSYNEESNIEGDVFLFYENGVKSGIMKFEEGERSGLDTRFYENGEISSTTVYKEGNANGDYRSFHENGKPNVKSIYEEGKQEGDYISYHENGKVKSTGKMLKGEMTGLWEFFYDNETLKKEAEYKKGTEIGEIKSFYKNGKIKSLKMLDESGKYNGTVKNYDDDGILYETYEYVKSDLTSIRSFSKKGKMTHNFEQKKSILEFETYNPRGTIDAIGTFNKEGRTDKWTYHTEIGVKESEMHYEEGNLEGEYLYFFADGSINIKQFYKDDSRDSIYLKYFQNGNLAHVGYYIEGGLQGEYYVTTPQGDTIEKEYYVDGSQHGRNHYYVKGKNGQKQITTTYTYHEGMILGIEEYDENGKIFYSKKLDKGNGKIQLHYPNQELYSTREYVNGLLEGELIYYSMDKPSLKANYRGDLAHGNWEWFYDNTTITKTTGEYKNGYREGKWVNYHENGNLDWVRYFTKGDLNDFDTSFHENGKLEIIRTRKDGEFEGESKFFDPNGNLYLARYYYKGEIIGYSYPDANGKLKPMIEIVNGSGKVLAYYSSGKKSFEVEYINGKLHGDYKAYFENGKLWKSIPQNYDENEGMRKEFYQNGNKKSEELMKNGNKEGKSKYYHLNGKLKKESEFWNDDEHGTTLVYDETGKLIKTQIWFNGNLMEEH